MSMASFGLLMRAQTYSFFPAKDLGISAIVTFSSRLNLVNTLLVKVIRKLSKSTIISMNPPVCVPKLFSTNGIISFSSISNDPLVDQWEQYKIAPDFLPSNYQFLRFSVIIPKVMTYLPLFEAIWKITLCFPNLGKHSSLLIQTAGSIEGGFGIIIFFLKISLVR